MRFHMTAAAVARDRRLGRESNPLTLLNRKKVTRYRANGEGAFEEMVGQFGKVNIRTLPDAVETDAEVDAEMDAAEMDAAEVDAAEVGVEGEVKQRKKNVTILR